MTTVVVLGGGLAGLVSAYELLNRADVRVVVVERQARIGGKLLARVVGSHMVDVGAEAFLQRRPEMNDLVAELGLSDYQVTSEMRGAHVWRGESLLPLPSPSHMGFVSDYATADHLLTEAEQARARADLNLPASAISSSDYTVGEITRTRCGDGFAEAAVAPLLSGVYAGDIDNLSMKMCVPALFEALKTHTSLSAAVASLQSQSAESKSGSQQSPFGSVSPHLYSVAQTLHQKIIERGGTVMLETEIEDVAVSADAVVVVTNKGVISADAVVVAVPAHAAATWSVSAEWHEFHSALEYSSMAIVSWELPNTPEVAECLSGTGFLAARPHDLFIKAATWSSLKWPSLQETAPDSLFIRASVGDIQDTAWQALENSEIAERAWHDICRVTGLDCEPRATLVTRWRDALPQYRPNHRERVQVLRSGLPSRVVAAGASYDGVGIPAVIQSANVAVSVLLKNLENRSSLQEAQ